MLKVSNRVLGGLRRILLSILIQRRSSQLMMQLMQLRKESLKKFRLAGIQTLTSVIPVHRSNKLSYKATGSWSLTWFVIHPGKMPMK